MNFGRIVRTLSIALGVVAVLYFTIGGFYVYQESQREETWHDEAVDNARDQSTLEWRAAKGSQPVAEWFYVNEKRHTYVVRLFENRQYVTAVYDQVVYGVGDPIDSPVPKRFATSELSRSEWRELVNVFESMFASREAFFQNEHRKDGNVTLAYSRDNAVPIRYRLYSDEYARWPALFREFDDLLFAAMESWPIKPHHGYAKSYAEIAYGPEEMPALVRILRSDREAAFPGTVSRMTSLGELARGPLIEILRSGETTRFLPTSRYIAVMDGLARLGGADDAGFELIRAIADTSASLPGRKELQANAAVIVGEREIEQHIDRTWLLPKDVEAQFRDSTLSADEEAVLAAALADTNNRLDTKKAQAKATLVAMGPSVLPAVLNQLQADQSSKRYPAELLDVLAEVGGTDAFVYAIRENGMPPSLATQPLERIGNRGVRGLLLLMASSDKVARMQSFYALEKNEYAAYSELYIEYLGRNLDLHRSTSSLAVRALHTEAAVSLIKLLQKHAATNRASIDVLLEAATDPEQAERTRIAALNSLSGLRPLPAATVDRLRVLSGYESGKVYDAVQAVIAK